MRRVVLAGCGHAHLEVVRGAKAFAARGIELVLVDPGRFWYSGLGSALLGGRIGEGEATIDAAALAAACGTRFVAGTVTRLDRVGRRVLLASGESLAYDLVSFNVGSRVPVPAGWDSSGLAAVKPIADVPALRERIAGRSGPSRIVVLGGGATGCELAGNLLHLRRSRGLDLDVTLVTAGAALVEEAPDGVRRRALQSLTRRGARVLLSSRATSAGTGHLDVGGGETIGFDHLVLATGLAAHPVVASLGLPVRPEGLRVEASLRSIADARVFAAGDCAAIEGYDLPKIGVYGVRAGPVLLANLLASLDGRTLRNFRPQRHALSILDLADGEGLAFRGGFWLGGRLALRLKAALDRRFLDRYRCLSAPVA